MPETKINIQSPFYKRYSATDLAAVVLKVYIYSGQKDTDKGSPKYILTKEALGGKDYVIFELSDIVKDYLEPTKSEPFTGNTSFVKWVQLEASLIVDGLIAENLELTTTKNTDLIVNMIGRDSLGKSITYNIVDNPTNGSLGTVSGNVVVYTPDDDYTGPDSFTYKVVRDEDSKESGVATVNITVNDLLPDDTIIFRHTRGSIEFRYEDSIECANELRESSSGVYTGKELGIYEDYEVGARLLDFDGDALNSSLITAFTGFFFVISTDSPNGIDEMVELGLDSNGEFSILDIQPVSSIGDCISSQTVSLSGPVTFSQVCSQTNFSTFYHNGSSSDPVAGDIIYTDSGLTSVASAGYYKISGQNKYLQIQDSDGSVHSINDC